MKNPVHPGDIVLHDCLEALNLSVDEGAKVLGIAPQALTDIVNGAAPISADIATRLAAMFGSTPEAWLRMQRAYNAGNGITDLNPGPS